jgi:hypothetical protein
MPEPTPPAMPPPTLPAGLSHLDRRKIEAGVLVPLIQAFQRALGKARANEIARDVVLELARQDGERWAAQFGDNLDGMEQTAKVWSGSGNLELTTVGRSADTLDFNVTRCQYAEYFQAMGLADMGYLIHCNRDFAMLDGFRGGLTLERTQTIMEGATHCDFRFRRKSGP